MIYYPISVLILDSIMEILIIETRRDLPAFRRLLADGSHLGVSFSYAEQPNPHGPDFPVRRRSPLRALPVAFVFGNKLLYGHDFTDTLDEADACADNATVCGYEAVDLPGTCAEGKN